jgi:signal peptidase I
MKKWLTNNRGVLVFLLSLGFFRTAVADWNSIPSGSMRPTLLEGDVVLVNRLAYDLKVPLTDRSLVRLGDPRRGDIVTFTSPKDGTRLIKRLIAIPGDVVEMRNEVLIVNGSAAEYADVTPMKEPFGNGDHRNGVRATEQVAGSRRAVQFLSRVNSRNSFDATTVPADQYFVLGDNRDNSEDSRYIGFVPRAAIIGRAERVLVSADIKGNWHPRLERTIAPLL